MALGGVVEGLNNYNLGSRSLLGSNWSYLWFKVKRGITIVADRIHSEPSTDELSMGSQFILSSKLLDMLQIKFNR